MRSSVRYQLATTSGYKFNIVKIGDSVYDELAYYHKDNFPDLEITRPNTTTDLNKLHTKALMTVNGYVYNTHVIDNKLYIPNATTSMLKSRQNNVGILSFNSLQNSLSKIKITESMISAEYPTTMFNKTIITFDRDIGYPILIIAGYMIFEHPEFFYRVSSNSFALRLDRLNYIEKLYELNRYRNIFDELGVPISPNNPSVIDGEVARSDLTIIKLLSTFNSFLVEVPVTSLTTNKIYLEHSNLPGNFRTEVEPNLPLFVGYGKLTEYTKRKNNDVKYNLYTCDAYYNNHLLTKLPPEEVKLYNDHRRPGNTYTLSPGFFLDINLEE